MVRKEYVVEEITKIMSSSDNIRNVAIIAHVHHGKTTLTDSLLARAGLISPSIAGDVLYTNYETIEKDRKLTIKSANISLGFDYKDKDYIINLIDTPGHVDFGGHVTRSMRAVDGVILVVDPVEGIMPQTETVLRQAIREKAKPILFVNKVDRLLNELRLTREQTFERLQKLTNDVNSLIEKFAPDELAREWKLSVENGSVAFGSAAKRWAISKPIMEKYHTTFKQIFDLTERGDEKGLQEVAPIDECTLIMMIDHLPSPKVAQRYRIPQIWHGDTESEDGRAMISCDISAKTNIVIFNIMTDPHSGDVPVGRVFSGVVAKGKELHISGSQQTVRVQQLGIYMGPDRVNIDMVPAGNIVALVGLKEANVGDTLSENIIEPFEQITHHSKPVVTKAIEAKDSRDTTKLIAALRDLSKADPTIITEINQETGEHLVSGMGELHLEIIETKLRNEFKVNIITSPPIIIYRETIDSKAGPIEGKTPNRHTKFYITVEPLPATIESAIDDGELKEGKPKGAAAVENMVKFGLDRQLAKNVVYISNKSVLADMTHGVQYMNEVMELLINGFESAMKDGPLARERVAGVLVSIVDASIHEDPVHRGPAQIIPAIRNAIYAGMLIAGVTLLEPKQIFTVHIPQDYMSPIISFLQSKRGVISEVIQDKEEITIKAKVPVADTLKGFSNDMRGLTQGRAIWYQEYAGYEKLPTELQNKVVREIRERKGIPPEPPTPNDFML